MPRYCDVSLPVPLDQSFTYSLPLTLQHRVKAGARVVAPFGARKLTGVVLMVHDENPGIPLKDVLRVIDPEPVLDDELIALARWISGYYCAPLGEVLRSMLPLSAEIRSGKVYSLTDAGRDASKQLSIDTSAEDDFQKVVAMLSVRPLSATYVTRKIPLADKILKSLERKGWISVEQTQNERDPLRCPGRQTPCCAHTDTLPQVKAFRRPRENYWLTSRFILARTIWRRWRPRFIMLAQPRGHLRASN